MHTSTSARHSHARLALTLGAALTWATALGAPAEDPGETRDEARGRAAESIRTMWPPAGLTRTGPVPLTHFPLAPEDLGAIAPMGVMVGGHVLPSSHMGVHAKDPAAPRDRYAVVAPADGGIVSIQHRVRLDGTTEKARAYDDWRVTIAHSRDFYTYVDLLTELAPDVRLAAGPLADGPMVPVRVPIRGGEALGRMGGGRGIDFGVVNLGARTEGFAVLPHYVAREPWRIFCVDAFPHYAEPLRSALLACNPRTAEPRGGRIDLDLPGTLQGGWFVQGTNGYAGSGDPRGYWIGHLHLGPHYIDPAVRIVSLGDWQGRPGLFALRDGAPDFAAVTPASGSVAYELVPVVRPSGAEPMACSDGRVAGALLVQLIDERTLRLETFPGRAAGGPPQGFTERARVYER